MINYIIGIDEVGRGALAGPVTVAAVALPRELRIMNYELGRLKDSKKLTEKQREEWFQYLQELRIKNKELWFAAASVYPKTIDRINISKAANLAATRALKRLLATSHWSLATRITVLLDGGLFVNKNSLVATGYTLNPRTVVRGDEEYKCIKLASIVAKVRRDRLMKRYHKKFPEYDFAEHKGYGTKRHIAAIKKYGACDIHRVTFLKNL